MWYQRLSQSLSFIWRLLTYDFCPSLNRTVYWVKHPLACLMLVAGVSLLVAVLLKPMAWAVFFGLLFVLALGMLWPWLAIRGIAAEVRFPDLTVTEGQPTRVSVAITNRWPWPVWGLSLERILWAAESHQGSPGSGGHLGGVALARISGWSTNTFHWTVVPSCRGVYPRESPTVGTGFPFGLWTCRHTLSVSNPLTVWPKTFPVETLLDADEAAPSEETYADCLTGDLGDMVGTRSFRQGDALRRVHWAQTARQDRLIVCERQASVLSQVEIVVDVSALSHLGSGPQSSLEWTIRIAASLAKAWHATPFAKCVGL